MSNELANLTNLPTTNVSDNEYDSLVKSGDYLPRIQLFGFKSDAVAKNMIPREHYGLVEGKEIIDLGETVTIVPIARRLKAMDTSDRQAPIISTNNESPLFKEIVARAGTPQSNCMFGPEYLVYLAGRNKLALLFLCSVTARNESKKIEPFMKSRSPITLSSRLASNAKGTWTAMVVNESEVPVSVPQEIVDRVVPEVDKFLVKVDNAKALAEPSTRER